MIKQVKFVVGTDLIDLEKSLNGYLLTQDADVTIQYDFVKNIAVVETQRANPTHLCCECRHWDDKGKHQALIGECPIRNRRTKYCDTACAMWKEIEK